MPCGHSWAGLEVALKPFHGITRTMSIVGEAPSESSQRTGARPFHGASGKFLAKLFRVDCVESVEVDVVFQNVLQKWPGRGYAGEKGSRFPMKQARKRASGVELHPVTILAGRRVAKAFGLDDVPYFSWVKCVGVRADKTLFGPFAVAVIPHPSGTNRFWNYEHNRILGREFLLAARRLSWRLRP